MNTPLTLSKVQKILLADFYSKPSTKVAFNTAERRKIWDEFKVERNLKKFSYLEEAVPAIFAEINKAVVHKKISNQQYLVNAFTPKHLPIYLIFLFSKII